MSFYFPARSRAMAAVSGVPFSMYIIQAFSMYWMASGIFFCSCLKGNKAGWRHLYLHSTCLLAVKTAGTLTFIIIPACSIALWIWGIALATHVGFIFLLVSVITVVKKKEEDTYFAAWKSLSVSLRKCFCFWKQQSNVIAVNSRQITSRIRLVFCVIFSFFQVSVLGLIILLRILEAYS